MAMLSNATFPEISTYELVKPSGMGSQLLEESVFPFLESASELDANSEVFLFYFRWI